MPRLEVEAGPGRLDAVLAERAIAAGRVLVNGVRRPKSFRLAGGERIQVDLPTAEPPAPEPEGVPVRYDDEHLLVVAKPAGVVTHPTASRRTGTLVNRLLGMGVPLSSVAGPDRRGIVHRLDAGTSGLLLVAKDDETHRRLVRLLAARRVLREYAALVRGRAEHDEFSVEAPLGRRGARVVVRRPGGAEAETSFIVIERLPAATLLSARPRTGRTHQIRVHLASIGHPVLGDRAYGGGGDDARRLGLRRPFLHAARLSFEHPATGRPVDVEEPLPDDLRAALERARR